MDFFERQDRARHNTTLLIVYFVGGVVLLIVAVYLAALGLFTSIGVQAHRGVAWSRPLELAWWRPQLFSGVALGTLAVIGLGSLFKTAELARGGSAVATMLGGEPVNPATTDPDERKLLNVVEEMAIAAGVPVPQVYLLREEQGINAFAAGHSASDAVIGVTQGSVRLLTRDELQGVIGHEFSHILNGDMRLNLRLMGIIFGILCLAVVGRILLQTRVRSGRDRNALPLLGVALLLIGWIGVFFGRLIQAAVSRQREFLADAAAVQFTRNPAGLAGALKKIGGLSLGSRLHATHADEASHMFFGNGRGESFLHLLDTHPSLTARVLALDPAFDGVFPPISLPALAELRSAVSPGMQTGPRRPPRVWARPSGGLASLAPPSIPAGRALAATGRPTPAHLRYAEALRQAIPESLTQAAREPLGASTLVYGLLLSEDEAARAKQLEELGRETSPAVVQETLRVWPELESVATHAKLPLVDLALPTLRHLSGPQFRQFSAAVQKLVESDGEIDLFEYVLQKILMRHLAPSYTGARKAIIQYYALRPLAGDCAVLLSALAYVGQSEPEPAQAAFQQGAQALLPALQVELELLAPSQCELSQVDVALDRLSQAAPQIKKNVLNACAQTVAADGVIEEMEAELLRAIADSLDCPIPPLIPEA